MDRTKFHVFLSHNSADKPAVEELAVRLRKEYIAPWLDKWNLIPGEAWQPAIEKALDDCATCAVFIGPSGMGPWQNEEMRAAIDRRVSRKDGFRVIPVLLPGGQREERSRLPTFLVATTWVEFRRTLDEEDAFHRLLCGIRGIAPGPNPGQAVFEGACPYRGLQVFRAEDAPFFFGREALTEWLLTMLRPAPNSGRENRFLAIIGASGSGKSSLARAGLVPALQRGELEGSEQWPVVICKPGPDPLESLAVALAADAAVGKGIGVADLINHLRDDPHTLHLTVRLALHGGPENRRGVVLVDQFEEIFTLCHDDVLRRALIDNLCHAASIMLGQTVVVLTMRADFYGKCSAYPTLAAALSDHQMLVGPMTEDELQRAIERPAQLVGGELESGLTEMLLQDVKNQAGALPLLEHALLELWKYREGRRMTVAAYKEIGELKGALEKHANKIYGALSAAEQDICRRILLRLTQPGEGTEDTKRRALRKELGGSESVDTVIRKLADARLITTGVGKQQATETEGQRSIEDYVEVSHEALIRGWPMLRGWINADRESLRVQHRLSDAAREWDAQKHDEAYLYRGVRLAEAEEWSQTQGDNLNTLERKFLEASRALRMMEQRTAFLANHDPLTGLINRRWFQEKLEEQIAYNRRYNVSGALLFMDFDQFKYINDTYGHRTGDEYLRQVAHHLRSSLRETDIIGRLEGDEFGIILPNVIGDQASMLGNALLKTLNSKELIHEGWRTPFNANIGIVQFPKHGDTASDLLTKADSAMYTAKEQGLNTFYTFQEGSGVAHMQEKIHWEERIHHALKENQFQLYFQPIVDIHTGVISHYESLLRMIGEDGKVTPPGAFIGIAERFGLIREIDRWRVANAIRTQGESMQSGSPVALTINLSGRHFGNPKILELIQETTRYYKADPSSIVFEVTETATVENFTEACDFIQALREMRYRFALDDFGASFSSFDHLKRIPVDYVKIDGSFVRNLNNDKVDQILVKAIADIANSLEVKTIAEFVENYSIVETLRGLGVSLGQGHYFAKPAPNFLKTDQIVFSQDAAA